MSPKFYGFLWILFFVAAGILWLGGVFTLTALVAFGFFAFGLVFVGMMCVLPGVVSHPPQAKAKASERRNITKAPAKSRGATTGGLRFPIAVKLR